jgi:putative protein-disulfide isomerase
MKNIIFALIFFSFINNLMSQEKPKLIYVGDPMCSWCYGFTNELSKVLTHYDNQLDLEMIMGGLRPYNQESIVELKEFLFDHWTDIHERTGQAFKFDILNDESFLYDTEPPSRAVVIIRSLAPDKEYDFFKAIQKAFYFDNANTSAIDTYVRIIKDWNIDVELFKARFNSEEWKNLTSQDFDRAARLGVSSFPTLLFKNGDIQFLISNGYQESAILIRQINSLLAMDK